MPDDRDRIAYHAALHLHEGRTGTVRDAILMARDELRVREGTSPGSGQVRRHLAALRMQAGGFDSYQHGRLRVLEAIDELIERLAWAFPELDVRLTGRLALGQLDGAGALYVRVHVQADVPTLLEHLQEQEGDEFDVATLETSEGRMSTISWLEGEHRIVLVRCPHRRQVSSEANLVTGRPVALLDHEGLQEALGDLRSSLGLSDTSG